MSAARLAAESLFSAPRPEEPKHQATVVVRKNRISTAIGAQAAAPASGSASSFGGSDDNRAPRVFRMDTAPAAVLDLQPAAANDEAVPMAAVAWTLPPPAVRLPVVDHKRPGPVVQIYSAPVQHVEVSADPVTNLTLQQTQTLHRKLVRLSATLADAQHAETLSFVDMDTAQALNGLVHDTSAMRAQLGRRPR